MQLQCTTRTRRQLWRNLLPSIIIIIAMDFQCISVMPYVKNIGGAYPKSVSVRTVHRLVFTVKTNSWACFRFLYRVSFVTWAPAGFFPGVGNEGSEGRKSPSRVQGQLPGGGLGAKPPEADDIFSKWCINTSYNEVLDHICSKKNTFQHF